MSMGFTPGGTCTGVVACAPGKTGLRLASTTLRLAIVLIRRSGRGTASGRNAVRASMMPPATAKHAPGKCQGAPATSLNTVSAGKP